MPEPSRPEKPIPGGPGRLAVGMPWRPCSRGIGNTNFPAERPCSGDSRRSKDTREGSIPTTLSSRSPPSSPSSGQRDLVPADRPVHRRVMEESRGSRAGRSLHFCGEHLPEDARLDDMRGRVGQAGNGTAMRTAMLGLYFVRDPERLPSAVADVSRITHQDPRSVAGGIAIAKAAQLLASLDTLDESLFCRSVADAIRPFEGIFAELVEGCHHDSARRGRQPSRPSPGPGL